MGPHEERRLERPRRRLPQSAPRDKIREVPPSHLAVAVGHAPAQNRALQTQLSRGAGMSPAPAFSLTQRCGAGRPNATLGCVAQTHLRRSGLEGRDESAEGMLA